MTASMDGSTLRLAEAHANQPITTVLFESDNLTSILGAHVSSVGDLWIWGDTVYGTYSEDSLGDNDLSPGNDSPFPSVAARNGGVFVVQHSGAAWEMSQMRPGRNAFGGHTVHIIAWLDFVLQAPLEFRLINKSPSLWSPKVPLSSSCWVGHGATPPSHRVRLRTVFVWPTLLMVGKLIVVAVSSRCLCS